MKVSFLHNLVKGYQETCTALISLYTCNAHYEGRGKQERPCHASKVECKPLSLMYIHKSELKPKEAPRINNVSSFFRGLKSSGLLYTTMFYFSYLKTLVIRSKQILYGEILRLGRIFISIFCPFLLMKPWLSCEHKFKTVAKLMKL